MSPAFTELTTVCFSLWLVRWLHFSHSLPNAHWILFDPIYPESHALQSVQMNWAKLWVGFRGTQGVLAGRGQRRRSPHPHLHPSCHKWKDTRITWNLNWFLWVCENEVLDIIWPPLMECVTDGPEMEQEKEHRQTTNAISGKDMQCLLKGATISLPLTASTSHLA